ncbi:MAG: hypothetical protein IPG33_07995 [Betaproteobacteria bacterium]|nr:hypothetical protein [Betaproteobacteria bacterium]
MTDPATYLRFYNVSWLGERVTADLRRRVFDHLLSLPPSYFEQGRTGAVISRLTSDTTLIENAIRSSLSIALRNLLLLIGGLAMLFTTNLKLTLMVLSGVPIVVVPIVLFGRRVRRFARISQDRVADLGNRIDETIHEIRIVQAYGHEDADRRDFAALVERGFATSLARIRNRTDCNLSALAEEIAHTLQSGDPERKADWIIAKGLQAHADPGLMRAALGNLLDNAWKYTARIERPRIEFGRDAGGVYFVRDNGIGFDTARVGERLFQPFQRFHNHDDYAGSGIGLATVARIIAKHGGRIWAESARNAGATFWLTLG